MDISSLPEDLKFEIRLQVALLRNAERIRDVSRNPEKFSGYIARRKEAIASLTGNEAEILYEGKKIYP